MMADAALKKTALYDKHLELGGKMVPFAGYSMPVQFPDGIKDSHLHVRRSAGVFDVSHMGQIRLHGKDAVPFLESLVVADVKALAPMSGVLSVFTTKEGTIIDDTIITNLVDCVGLVINGACKDKDIDHINEHLAIARTAGKDVILEVLEDRELFALQGPKAMSVLQTYVKNDLTKMPFMVAAPMEILGTEMLVTRCGYTGEDGFEISVPRDKAVETFESFIDKEEVRAAGLGARDSLRMEAGLCLYGNDIDDTTTPVEAALTWTIAKRRRAEGGFLGSDVILPQIEKGTSRRRMGFVMKGPPARGHEKIFTATGEEVGEVTSGGFSPSLGTAIGMGYAKKPFNKSGTKLMVQVRNRSYPLEVVKTPMVPTNYYKVPE
mmetsp:Transcript_34598/g.84739  ORF Transcript_34598/g.84739 Transcript_34598/m.84739 type:complete len:378 (-) Transcript_34598:85-1218(-)